MNTGAPTVNRGEIVSMYARLKCTGSNGGYQLGVISDVPFDVVGRTCSAICGPGNS